MAERGQTDITPLIVIGAGALLYYFWPKAGPGRIEMTFPPTPGVPPLAPVKPGLKLQDRSYIKWVQESLNKVMGSQLVVDGILGSETKGVVRLFQFHEGLTMDGIPGPRTEAMIKNRLQAIAAWY